MTENENIPRFFDRKGQPIGLMNWAEKWEDPKYREVAKDRIGKYVIITYWIGMHYPGIFETSIFMEVDKEDAINDLLCDYEEHSSTEEEALHEHKTAVQQAKIAHAMYEAAKNKPPLAIS